MRYFKASNAVEISLADIEAFNRRWPCSELRECCKGFTVYFDSKWDLVDVTGKPASIDGPAVVAIIGDAEQYARRKCGV